MTSSVAPPVADDEVLDLVRRLRAGERRALARAITLVESQRDADQVRAMALLEQLLPFTGKALRVGISGTPGVGKSTFIEAIGWRLLEQGHRVAVLAVDPSSPTTGGSILGDKTRMERLAHDDRAFVRPTPSGGALGGIATRTREAMLVCEAAGYDVVIIETVGVGQSEHAVSAITDTFVDLVVVNKADGPREAEAADTASHYRIAGHLLHHHKQWRPPVLLASAVAGTGLDVVWQTVLEHTAFLAPTLQERRAQQAERWLWTSVEHELVRRLHTDADTAALLPGLLDEVRLGKTSPGRAALSLVERFLSQHEPARAGSAADSVNADPQALPAHAALGADDGVGGGGRTDDGGDDGTLADVDRATRPPLGPDADDQAGDDAAHHDDARRLPAARAGRTST